MIVGLEAHLQHPIAQSVTVKRLDGKDCLLVIGHGDEAETLALVGLQIPNNLKESQKPKTTTKAKAKA